MTSPIILLENIKKEIDGIKKETEKGDEVLSERFDKWESRFFKIIYN